MIDTHCHLDDPHLYQRLEAVLSRSRAAGVSQWVVPGVSLAGFPALQKLQRPGITLALGLHPFFMAQHPVDAIDQLQYWLGLLQPPLMGEIGLDYTLPATTHAAQQHLLRQQLRLAQQRQSPLLLHVRKAHEPMLQMLNQLKFPWGGIVHAFNGSLDQATRYGRLGFKLGFGGMLTRPHSRRLQTLARSVDDTALVLETDAPDLPPHPHKGKINEPALLPVVAQKLADLRGVSLAQMVALTSRNARVALNLEC
ncbi:TatD-related deoxyribonuclease [Magnetococcus marinus MC-1]|uniref:TatD-related deoxyribonuclease n=1 Tax=Magnetococcus marinus (strain ATCC BAA-1437 / JCM 17883 / MC-1) TaxID=156889 RepID=A0L6L2_MAGMM|nr:TatD family hydrolase [Magnetococcus marinus]ABK43605.1 TatD-related deoxyribonuclease [Magnetococcus marinus MC-1]